MSLTKKNLHQVAFFVACLFISKVSFCQRDIDSSNLIKFLQQNTDSTIVFFCSSPLVFDKDVSIISKVENSVLYFQYDNPYKRYSIIYNLPKGEIGKKLRQEALLFEHTMHDTNRYFLPKDIRKGLREPTWRSILKLYPWKLVDDNDSAFKQTPCKDYESGGPTLHLFLINKDRILRLAYHDPRFFEECTPGNINRQRMLKIEKIFESIFGQD